MQIDAADDVSMVQLAKDMAGKLSQGASLSPALSGSLSLSLSVCVCVCVSTSCARVTLSVCLFLCLSVRRELDLFANPATVPQPR